MSRLHPELVVRISWSAAVEQLPAAAQQFGAALGDDAGQFGVVGGRQTSISSRRSAGSPTHHVAHGQVEVVPVEAAGPLDLVQTDVGHDASKAARATATTLAASGPAASATTWRYQRAAS